MQITSNQARTKKGYIIRTSKNVDIAKPTLDNELKRYRIGKPSLRSESN